MSEQLWMDENDRIATDFIEDKIDEAEFRRRMARQGFDPDEIEEHLASLID